MSSIAIIATGGKQYLVKEGDVVTIEKLPAGKGDKVVFDTVLLTDDGKATKIGSPHITGAKVSGEVIGEGLGEKKIVMKYRQKSRYYKKKGHRQPFTKVKITSL